MITSNLVACLSMCLSGIISTLPMNADRSPAGLTERCGAPATPWHEHTDRVQVREFALAFPNDAERGHLDIDIKRGDILVTAYDGDQVLVRLSIPKNQQGAPKNADGAFQTLSATPVDLEVRQNGNFIELDGNSYEQITNVEVLVPRDIDLTLDSYRSGVIRVTGVAGQVRARSQDNDIVLTDIAGSARLIGRNGSLSASFSKVIDELNLETYNGDIDLTLPADVKTTAFIRAVHGTVQSQLPIKERPLQVELTTSEDGSQSIEFGEYYVGDINGGGTESVLETTNGSVRLRKLNTPSTHPTHTPAD